MLHPLSLSPSLSLVGQPITCECLSYYVCEVAFLLFTCTSNWYIFKIKRFLGCCFFFASLQPLIPPILFYTQHIVGSQINRIVLSEGRRRRTRNQSEMKREKIDDIVCKKAGRTTWEINSLWCIGRQGGGICLMIVMWTNELVQPFDLHDKIRLKF